MYLVDTNIFLEILLDQEREVRIVKNGFVRTLINKRRRLTLQLASTFSDRSGFPSYAPTSPR